ncbi:A24 family peptidase [Gordonia neofelifaecis]|uniref:Prepilin type IV endopeptidase peptidase domain-containing protein n=1 Tax=Gordonia neofelifaecis NRRL B-59395 TaxID=644548 RepID=F1YG86_9ACTN|nr:A24 family peptidase [Gordonia neofelifaecis]EGD56059.1 hypothetical protein SCNU_04346 [Gordonia neofelifaecis NRRL B-59395]
MQWLPFMPWPAVSWLAIVAVVDARTGRIPNTLVIPAVVPAAGAALADTRVVLAVVTATAPYLIAFLARNCGGGDVKLAAPCGALVSDPASAAFLVAAAAVASLVACAVARRRTLPHGPALAAATALMTVLRYG